MNNVRMNKIALCLSGIQMFEHGKSVFAQVYFRSQRWVIRAECKSIGNTIIKSLVTVGFSYGIETHENKIMNENIVAKRLIGLNAS